VFGLALLLIVVGAGSVFAYLQAANKPVEGAMIQANNTITPTVTLTATITPTLNPTETETPEPTITPLPPVQYKVAANDTCGSIAYVYGISVNSIIQVNKLSADCILSIGQELLIPQPTLTPSPMPTNTLNPTEQAMQDCQQVEYIVKDGDTLGKIAANYAVSPASVQQYSGLPSDIVMLGQKLVIPLCEQSLEAPTATPVPPYPAPNLLLPADGAFFRSNDTVTLQWAAVGNLRQNEAYAVTVIDATDGNARKLVGYVTDTKYIVPDEIKPGGNDPHIYYWTVLPVRQTGTNKDTGEPEWSPAGEPSNQRSFSWTGGSSAATPTP
jgi:LysM repeat protein